MLTENLLYVNTTMYHLTPTATPMIYILLTLSYRWENRGTDNLNNVFKQLVSVRIRASNSVWFWSPRTALPGDAACLL